MDMTMNGKVNVAIFGLGRMFEKFMDIYDSQKVNIVCLCDNNESLWNQTRYEIKVVSPMELAKAAIDKVIVTGKYADFIANQLEQRGIAERDIVKIKEEKDFHNENVKPYLASWEKLLGMELENQEKCLNTRLDIIEKMQEKNLFLNASILIKSFCGKDIDSLAEVEFKVFSQFGEDGIIQWLIHNVDIKNEVFVEFGVEDYQESNTRFLMMNNNWSGLVIDGSSENIKKIKQSDYYWRHDLLAVDEFITKDNINKIITNAGISGDIGLLSVDIDGNDYWVLENINCISPRILICEYNSVFGADKAVSIPYDNSFVRQEKHYSYLYWGVSLKALCIWAEKNGYYFVGSNSAGNNAFFVKKEFISKEKLPKRASYVESRYRESRDRQGQMSYLRGKQRLEEIKDMEVVNTEDNTCVMIKELYKM